PDRRLGRPGLDRPGRRRARVAAAHQASRRPVRPDLLRPRDRGATVSGEEWLDEQQQDHWRAYLRGSRLLERDLVEDLAPSNVQLTEYVLLSMLSEAPGQRMRMSRLADLIIQSRSRVTHTATRLEKRGWVERCRSG